MQTQNTLSLFPDYETPNLPPAMRRAILRMNAADVVASFRLAHNLALVFRPNHDAAGLGTLGDAARVFFGLKLENACCRYFESFAGLRSDTPPVPQAMLPDEAAIEKALVSFAQHLLRRLEKAKHLLNDIVQK